MVHEATRKLIFPTPDPFLAEAKKALASFPDPFFSERKRF
jgi:hypothetical protein